MDLSLSQKVELIWNRGIAARCDLRIPDEFPGERTYLPIPAHSGELWSSRLPKNLIPNPEASSMIEEGSIVWVRLCWLASFVRQVLPLVKARFILVTADSDTCVPSKLKAEARIILGSPKVLHWYTQNYDGTAPPDRVSPIPIGIDFHTLYEKPYWGEPVSSPWDQERELVSIRKQLPPLRARIPEVYVDFAWQRGFGLHRRFAHPLEGTRFDESRRRTVNQLRGNTMVRFQRDRLPRHEVWRKRGEYAFVLSPHGWGLDCHRTWEALALGHIVLVPSSSLDGLFTGLPVIPLKSWDEITHDNLGRWLSMHPDGGACHEKLKSAYWVGAMRSKRSALAG